MNRSLLVICICVICILHAFEVRSQEFPMLHYTIEEGLPSNVVYCVYRDSQGFIWVSTDKGVARFNGLKFETFSTFNQLPDNEVFFLQEDAYKRLWLGTFTGTLCYFQNGVLRTAANTAFLNVGRHPTHMRHISLEYDSSIIIGFFDPAKIITINHERCRYYDIDSLVDPNASHTLVLVRKIAPDKFKLVFCDKIEIVDTAFHVLEVHPVDSMFFNPVLRFSVCQNTELMFNDNIVFDEALHIRTKIPRGVSSSGVHEIYPDNNSWLFATHTGLVIGDSIRTLIDEDVSAVTQDNSGNYWISTLTGGLYSLRKDFLLSALHRNVYHNEVRYAETVNGFVFFETSGNDLYSIDQHHKIAHLYDNPFPSKEGRMQADFGFLIDNSFRCFSSNNNYIARIDNVFRAGGNIARSNLGEATKTLLISDDFVYAKQHHSIARFRASIIGGAFSPTLIGKSGNMERIFGMAKAPDGAIWYSTFNGMFRITNDLADGVRQHKFDAIPLKYFVFFGQLLIGYTHGNRMVVCSGYSSDNFRVDSISQRDCIWDKLYAIDSAHMLVSTNNRYRLLTAGVAGKPDTFTIKAIDNPYLPLHAEAICISGSNCYFFKSGNVTIFDTGNLLEKPAPPSLFYTAFKANGKRYPVTDMIELPYSESRQMSLFFTVQSFDSRNITMQFSLTKGGADEWQDVASEELNLVNPGYGEWLVKVKGRSSISEFSKPIVFRLHILRPFWATWWFAALVVGAAFLILWLSVRYRIRSLLRAREKEHISEIRFMRSEYKALNALMNPHFIFNTLNNVQGLVNRNDKRAANEYIRVFSDLIRQNMHNISKELIPLQKEVDLVSNYLLLEKLRFKDHLNYSVNVQAGVDLSEVTVPPLLIQPLVENSIKHGILPMESDQGKIQLHIYENDRELVIEVKDNGVGMSNAAGTADHESYGLSNIRKRIEHLCVIQGKQITLALSEPKDPITREWTTVTITIPLS